jgi:predicted TIM-barrel fold metal-dependent hydrolase
MKLQHPSRRTFVIGAAGLAGAMLGVGGREAAHYFAMIGPANSSSPGVTDPKAPPDEPQLKAPAVKAVIDAHIHVVNTKLPGVPLSIAPNGTHFGADTAKLADAIKAEMKEGNVAHALCMPSREMNEKDPLGVQETRALAKLVPGLHPVGFADPERAYDDKHMAGIEDELKRPDRDVVAFKAYLGYLHHGPESPGYRPYYRLAAKYDIPVIFHTGDNWSQKAKVKYAHPLPIDDVAVDYPETKFVIAHFGNPWLMSAAEVIYKNNKKKGIENVWADLSAFLVGTADEFAAYRKQGAIEMVFAEVRKAFAFAERPDRFLFGSDWPLAPLAVYRDFIAEMIPKEHHQAVFHDNAKKLFGLK